eukprot:gene35669-47960_t
MSTYSRTTAFSNLFSKKSYCIPSFFNSKGVLHGTKPIASPILTTKRTTTILCVRKNGIVVMAGDGQVSQGSSVVKGNARKVRRIGKDVLVGFAGSTADAMALMERLERKLEEHPGQLFRACVELAKSLELTGNGDVLEPEPMKGGDLLGVGSGGNYAVAAARALIDRPDVEAEEIVRESMKIASDLCVYTNHNYIESLAVEAVSEIPSPPPLAAIQMNAA